MASTAYSTPAPAQQPGLNAFVVCDRVPEGCTAYLVPDNRQAPLLRAGEWVVVDPTDVEPVEGELFVIRWQSNPDRPQVVECGLVDRMTTRAGEPVWSVGARQRLLDPAALTCAVIGLGLFVISLPGMLEKLRREPPPVKMWQPRPMMWRIAGCATLSLIASIGVVSTR